MRNILQVMRKLAKQSSVTLPSQIVKTDTLLFTVELNNGSDIVRILALVSTTALSFSKIVTNLVII